MFSRNTRAPNRGLKRPREHFGGCRGLDRAPALPVMPLVRASRSVGVPGLDAPPGHHHPA